MRAGVLCLALALGLLPASLQAQPPITRERAEAVALRLVRGGEIVSGNLERDKQRLLWWFDISIPGSRNLNTVQIDAYTAAVVSSRVETPEGR